LLSRKYPSPPFFPHLPAHSRWFCPSPPPPPFGKTARCPPSFRGGGGGFSPGVGFGVMKGAFPFLAPRIPAFFAENSLFPPSPGLTKQVIESDSPFFLPSSSSFGGGGHSSQSLSLPFFIMLVNISLPAPDNFFVSPPPPRNSASSLLPSGGFL